MNARDPALAVCEPGQGAPLGASCLTLQGREGVNFAVHSSDAERVEVCLFDESGLREVARWSLPGRTGAVWHGFVPGITCGQLYGLRAHGPYRPASGQRFNPAKLLIDPFARALEGSTTSWRWSAIMLGRWRATRCCAMPRRTRMTTRRAFPKRGF